MISIYFLITVLIVLPFFIFIPLHWLTPNLSYFASLILLLDLLSPHNSYTVVLNSIQHYQIWFGSRAWYPRHGTLKWAEQQLLGINFTLFYGHVWISTVVEFWVWYPRHGTIKLAKCNLEWLLLTLLYWACFGFQVFEPILRHFLLKIVSILLPISFIWFYPFSSLLHRWSRSILYPRSFRLGEEGLCCVISAQTSV